MNNPFDFRLVPCYEPHPEAKKMADYFEHIVQGKQPSSFLTDEQFAGAITLCAHTLAVLFIRMLRRTNPMVTFAAIQGIGSMITNMVQAYFGKQEKQILLAKGGEYRD